MAPTLRYDEGPAGGGLDDEGRLLAVADLGDDLGADRVRPGFQRGGQGAAHARQCTKARPYGTSEMNRDRCARTTRDCGRSRVISQQRPAKHRALVQRRLGPPRHGERSEWLTGRRRRVRLVPHDQLRERLD
jgi:hypothetical protein